MNWNYVAGFFDGEGSVTVRTHQHGKDYFSLLFYNTHLPTLRTLRAFLHCGSILKSCGGKGHQKQVWVLKINRQRQNLSIAKQLVNRTIIKRPKLRKLIRILSTRNHNGELRELTRSRLKQLYWENAMSPREIALLVGCCPTSITNKMTRLGIRRRPRGYNGQVTRIRDCHGF